MAENGNIVQVKNLSKTFGSIHAVEDVTFNVKKGEIFAFLGPNGAGKSTTIKMLTTLLQPTKGEITLNGFDSVKDSDNVRKSFGIIFQDPSLDEDLTAYENMELHGVLYNVAKEVRKERIEKLMKVTELWDRKDDLVKHYSGGMKRRLEIARGLLHHPKIFFLDEPTVGLDPQTRNHIWGYIKELNKTEGITIFFTTHYMDEAEKYSTRIAVIDRGKIVAQGTANELKKKTGKKTLEDAFIDLTGHAIREEEANALDGLRMQRRMHRR
ncbi:MAG: ATP-binding cassette domain-containing protein [Candidatus Diapherotrites archaeon]|nr:ATP-binding cassette domain-containing protein [Candidatus Diapherotrites archaeon]